VLARASSPLLSSRLDSNIFTVLPTTEAPVTPALCEHFCHMSAACSNMAFIWTTLLIYTVTERPVANQWLSKQRPLLGSARNLSARDNMTPFARQRISKQDFSTIRGLCFLCDPCWVVIKGRRNLFEWVIVKNCVEFCRWQFKAIRKEREWRN
jgi:hypothetical protein